MEVIEDGNIMDRIPILLQRDFEYYQKNQTVLTEVVCPGVVGGRLDFPRSASFAAVKIVCWLEDEFYVSFKHGSGMFVELEERVDSSAVAKTSDPDKFVQVTIKSVDMLLEHLHVLVQEALDHADLPVLNSTLGAATLVKNSLHCYMQHLDSTGRVERLSLMQTCYKRFVTMYEAVGERVLDLHNRVLSLYILQDCGGRAIDDASSIPQSGSPSIYGWWLYMQGTKKDLWDTVPPRMAQRIFAGMLNETLTILNVRYCQTLTSKNSTTLLINDILNILLCVSQLLPAICTSGSDLAGFDVKSQSRDVRDIHAKCSELFQCMVYRGADLHYIHQAFIDPEKSPSKIIQKERPSPWFTFVSPNIFENFDECIHSTKEMTVKKALGLELIVLLAQPQPSWSLLVKVLMMRDSHLFQMLLLHSIRCMSTDNHRWPASGRWCNVEGKLIKCKGFLCTADGYCNSGLNDNLEHSKLVGALTFIIATIGSKNEFHSSFIYALEISGRDWAACLDRKQVWCDRRPPWLAGILGLVDSALEFLPPILVNAIKTSASMYQTMSLCISCLTRTLDCLPQSFMNVSTLLEKSLPCHIKPVGGSMVLQLLITVLYEEMLLWSKKESEKEKESPSDSEFCASSISLAIAEALCSIDEDHKHKQEIEKFVAFTKKEFTLSKQFGLDDFPDIVKFSEEGNVPGSNAERSSDAAALTTHILMLAPGRDSLRIIYDYLIKHSERILCELGVQYSTEPVHNQLPLKDVPLIYIMFHINRMSFDMFLRNEWQMPWSRLVQTTKSWSDIAGASVHILRREDFREHKTNAKNNKNILELSELFKSSVKQGL